MALRFIDSFDHYATADFSAKYTSSTGTPTISSGNGRRSSNCLRINGGGTFTKTLDSQATWVVGFAFRLQTLPSASQNLLLFNDAGSDQSELRINPDGTFSVRRAGISVLGTSSAAISAGVYYFIEFKLTISDAAGLYHLKVNGDTILSASGVDTKSTANASANSIVFGISTNTGQGNTDYDDLYICDGSSVGSPSVNVDFLGDIRVDALFANGNGNSSQMTGSDGNSVDNYLLVDDTTPDGDSTYVESSTVGQKDTYAFGDLSHSPSAIYGVQVNMVAKKDDAGARSICSVVRSGGADTDGTTQGLSTSYVDYTQILEVDPNTAAAWTQTNLNAAEFGHKVAA